MRLKEIDVLFNVCKAVNFILDEKSNRYFRAIKLFKLHVAIRLANGRPAESKQAEAPSKSLAPAFLVKVPKKTLRDAELFATIKILEHIEAQIKEKHGTISAKLLATDRDWNILFDKKFVRLGGFHRVRYLPNAAEFDATLSKSKKQADRIAKLIDFILRFEGYPNKKTQALGITLATEIVAETQHLDVGCQKRTLETYWSKYEPVAAFLPLISLKKYRAWPLKVSKKRFVEKLMSRLDDRNELLSFFAEHNVNVLHLQNVGYDLQTVATRVELPKVEVNFDPLPKEALEYLAN